MADPMFAEPGQAPEGPQGGFSPPTVAPPAPDSALPPHHPAARKNPPDNFSERMTGLSEVHPWMPPQTAALLASSSATDRSVAQIAAALRRAYGTVDDAIHYTTEDPLLQKDPSLGLAVRSYLTNTIGPWPLADKDLIHMQKQLQKQGWGKGLPTDGLWNNGWNSAYSQYVSSAKAAALGGDQPGSTPLGHVLNIMNSLLPRQAATAVTAWAKGLPSSLSQDVGIVGGSIGGTISNLEHPATFLHPLSRETGAAGESEARMSAAGQNIVPGQHVTAESAYAGYNSNYRTQLAQTIQAAGDLFLAHGAFRAGSTIARAAGETGLTNLNADEAARGPGTIAKILYNTKTGGNPTGVLSRVAARNNPILRLTGPLVGQLDDGSAYYKARTLLASPYQVGAVRTAGTGIGQLGYQGLKTQGVASLTTAVGGQKSQLQQSIDHMQTINQFDDALQTKLGFTVLGHHIAPGLNTLAWVLHPPMDGPGQLSASVGKDVTGANQAIINTFGDQTGLGIQIERALDMVSKGKFMLLVRGAGEAGGRAWTLR